MTKFNPENKETLTYEESLGPAMNITDEEDAKQYKKAYIEYTQRKLEQNPRADNITAEQIVNANLGYFAGYYSNETRNRVEKLFFTQHPILGKSK